MFLTTKAREFYFSLQDTLQAGGPEVRDTAFSALQQVSRALRSVLAHELQTRLELHVPRP